MTEDIKRKDYEILVEHSAEVAWSVKCDYLAIEIDSLIASEAITLVGRIVDVLEAMFP